MGDYMNNLSILLINIIILLCPLLLYLFYCTYIDITNKEVNETFLDLAILSSLYLLISNYRLINNINFIILLNIPLIIGIYKKRTLIILISALIIVYFNYFIGYKLIYLIMQYIVYFLIYLLHLKKKISFNINLILFILIQAINLIINSHIKNSCFDIILNLIIFSIITYLILYLFKKCESITKLYMSIKELEREKQFRNSLFKITHEIKNPIAVCKSYLDMYDKNNPDHQRFIPIIKEEIESILLLLQDFLSMNKIKIQNEIMDINLLLEDVVNHFSNILENNKIEFKYNISNDEIIILGDYNRLHQVLVNIIKNSIEAVDNNKKSFISIDYEIINNNFKIIIKDNGIGILESDLEKIKEPFYTTKKNGTGLGVSLSYEIINAHEGNIIYNSEYGKYTEVIIELPIKEII